MRATACVWGLPHSVSACGVPVHVYLWACFVVMFWNMWRVWGQEECCFAWFYKKEEAPGTWGPVLEEAFEVMGGGLSAQFRDQPHVPVKHCGPPGSAEPQGEQGLLALPWARWPRGVWWPFCPAPASAPLPSGWEPCVLPDGVSPGLWTLVGGLSCLEGATGWDLETESAPVELGLLRLVIALRSLGFSFPICDAS